VANEKPRQPCGAGALVGSSGTNRNIWWSRRQPWFRLASLDSKGSGKATMDLYHRIYHRRPRAVFDRRGVESALSSTERLEMQRRSAFYAALQNARPARSVLFALPVLDHACTDRLMCRALAFAPPDRPGAMLAPGRSRTFFHAPDTHPSHALPGADPRLAPRTPGHHVPLFIGVPQKIRTYMSTPLFCKRSVNTRHHIAPRVMPVARVAFSNPAATATCLLETLEERLARLRQKVFSLAFTHGGMKYKKIGGKK